jgi:hypothetical protein
VPRRVLLLLLFALACSTQRIYDGRACPPGETALIVPGRDLAHEVFLVAVDGRRLGWFRDRARVLPGRHTIEVTVVFRGAREVAASHTLALDARAGATYTLQGEWATHGPGVALRDAHTRERVAAAAPRPRQRPPVGAGPR